MPVHNPCYGCGDRAIWCHTSCERYANYKKELDRIAKEQDVVKQYLIDKALDRKDRKRRQDT